MEQANVLSHLVKDENSFTEMLKALCDLKPIRDVVIKTFTQNQFDANAVEFSDIKTQFDIGGARPDICIQTDELSIAVEIKVSDWLGLTLNQPIKYLEWLIKQPTKYKFFVFLTTPHYSVQHHYVYKQRKDNFEQKTPQHGITFVEINWLELRAALQETELSSSCNYTRDFENLIEEWFLSTPITFTHAELQVTDMYNKDAANALSKLLEIVEKIAPEIERAGLGLKVEQSFKLRFKDDSEYAIYIYCGDKLVLFLGLWVELWKKHGFPLCIGVHEKWDLKVVSRFKSRFTDLVTYPQNNPNQYVIKKIKESLLMEDKDGDAVKKISDWLLTGYLKDICTAVNDNQSGNATVVDKTTQQEADNQSSATLVEQPET